MYTQQDFSAILKGMDVFDKDGQQVGTIKEFRLGDGEVDTDELSIEAMSEIVEETLESDLDLPVEFVQRLYEFGFVVIDRGFMTKPVLAFLDQVKDVTAEAMHLQVGQNELPVI